MHPITIRMLSCRHRELQTEISGGVSLYLFDLIGHFH